MYRTYQKNKIKKVDCYDLNAYTNFINGFSKFLLDKQTLIIIVGALAFAITIISLNDQTIGMSKLLGSKYVNDNLILQLLLCIIWLYNVTTKCVDNFENLFNIV